MPPTSHNFCKYREYILNLHSAIRSIPNTYTHKTHISHTRFVVRFARGGHVCIACNDYGLTEESPIELPQPFSVAEAIDDFETCTMRATRTQAPKAGFQFGHIDVDWENAETRSGAEQYYIEAPIRTEYEYPAQMTDVTVRTYSRLVSIKDKEGGSVFTYIKTFIPSSDYARTHVMGDMRKITNVGRQDDFSGTVVYTDLTGLPLNVT